MKIQKLNLTRLLHSDNLTDVNNDDGDDVTGEAVDNDVATDDDDC